MEAVHLATATATDTARVIPGLSASHIQTWLPVKVQLSMRNRLFSKNIFRTRDIWNRGTTSYKAAFVSALVVAAACYLVYGLLHRLSSHQAKPFRPHATVLVEDDTTNRLDNQLDSDEYEYEDEEESSRSFGFLANSKDRLVLRKMLGRSDPTLSRRPSIVRIVSSDPSSSLCERPMHVDLEPPTRRSFWPAPVSHSPPSDSSAPNSPVVPSPALSTTLQRSTSSSSGTAATRRRKESGRLHTASPSRSPLASATALASRPARLRSVDARSPLARTAARNKRNSTSSISSTDSPRPAVTQDALAAAEQDQLPGTPSITSEASSLSAALGHSSALADDYDASACSSPTSSTFSLARAPSILKRRPQSFRTASLREIDISYSLMQRRQSLPTLAALAPGAESSFSQQQQQELWHANGILQPFGPGSPPPPPYQSCIAQISPGPSETETLWPRNAKARSIKLVEPDWRPHTESHIRARERLETASRFAAFKASAMRPAPDTKFDQVDLDSDEFWFERFTQSTAAAGRDWDWRKRRARLQRAAALGMALGQSSLATQPSPNLPGNVGMTDVHLQQRSQQAGATIPASQTASSARKQMRAAPLITFTEQELKTTPVLQVDTASLSPTVTQGNGTPMSPTPSGMGTPLGGIFGAAGYSEDSVDSVDVVKAARVAQRRRASEDAGSAATDRSRRGVVNKITRRRVSASAAASIPSSPGPSSQSDGPSTSFNAEGFATSPLRETSASPLFNQMHGFIGSSSSSSSEMDLHDPYETETLPSTGMSSSYSVPGRLSSLSGSVGKKVGLTNLRVGLRTGSASSASGNGFMPNASGIDLVPTSPDLDAQETMDGTGYSEATPSPEGPRSSADAYSYATASSEETVPPSMHRSSRKNELRRVEKWDLNEASLGNSNPPLFHGGSCFARQASAPAASLYQELRQDVERGSISRESNDSDSLRRRMRARSQTESASLDSGSLIAMRNSAIAASKDGIAALAAGIPTSTPPAVKSRARNGSRSSIMRSASGASSDLNRSAKRRSSLRPGSSLGSDTSSITSSIVGGGSGSRTGSLRHSSSPVRSRRDSCGGVPDPQMQPEPAPRGMAQRARSASISSNASSLASANSSRTASRRNSFRDAGGAASLLGLSMTSSNPATPGAEAERRTDPFSMTAIST